MWFVLVDFCGLVWALFMVAVLLIISFAWERPHHLYSTLLFYVSEFLCVLIRFFWNSFCLLYLCCPFLGWQYHPLRVNVDSRLRTVLFLLLLLSLLLGRLFIVDLIKPVSNVRPSILPSVRPQSFFGFNEIWHIGRGRWVMHDGMQYNPI